MVTLDNQQETSLDPGQWLNAGTPEVNLYMTIVEYFCHMYYQVCFEFIDIYSSLSNIIQESTTNVYKNKR